MCLIYHKTYSKIAIIFLSKNIIKDSHVNEINNEDNDGIILEIISLLPIAQNIDEVKKSQNDKD